MLRLRAGASDSETVIHKRGSGARLACISQGRMQALKLSFALGEKRKTVNIVLPKLHHGTGEVGGVPNGVVCVALLCIPRVVARAPR